jgi:predicted RNA binding protein YcfA (HicA-like mRNA interferase family)
MTRLSPIDHAELVAGLRRHGFNGPHAGGKHLYMVKDGLRLTIPNPHRGEIGPELSARILRQTGIGRDQWVCA